MNLQSIDFSCSTYKRGSCGFWLRKPPRAMLPGRRTVNGWPLLRNQEARQLFKIKTDGRDLQQLTYSECHPIDFAWSPK